MNTQESAIRDEISDAVARYMKQHGISEWHPRAALIDMDGTLIDSMGSHSLAWHQMTSEHGMNIPVDEFYLYEGMTGKATIKLLWERELGVIPSDEECKRLYQRKADLFNSHPPVGVMPGAREMLRELKRCGVLPVLVTGSGQRSTIERLEKDFPGIFRDDLRITSADVTRGKPDPEPYLKGMERAGVKPTEAIVIENAPLGVESGHRAGAFTIAVTTGPIPAECMRSAGADLVLRSMDLLARMIPDILPQTS